MELHSSLQIAVVEDDAVLAATVEEMLLAEGYGVHLCPTGAALRQLLEAGGIDLILLDLNLPDGSGLDLLRQIVEQKLPVRVVVMTAFPLHHLRPNYPARTLVDWLTKPVPPGQLLAAVEQALATQDAA